MTVAAQRYKILANMFSRAIRNLDQILVCTPFDRTGSWLR